MEMKSILEYPDISFIDNMSIEDIQDFYIAKMQEKYKEMTGQDLILHDADPVRMLAYSNCLILYQIAQYADRAGKMALLKYSYGDYLDNIGALKGISRNEGKAAKTRLRFTLSARRPGTMIIREGIRVTASDGVYFKTTDLLEIPAGSLYGEVNAECRDIGKKGNDYDVGTINISGSHRICGKGGKCDSFVRRGRSGVRRESCRTYIFSTGIMVNSRAR